MASLMQLPLVRPAKLGLILMSGSLLIQMAIGYFVVTQNVPINVASLH